MVQIAEVAESVNTTLVDYEDQNEIMPAGYETAPTSDNSDDFQDKIRGIFEDDLPYEIDEGKLTVHTQGLMEIINSTPPKTLEIEISSALTTQQVEPPELPSTASHVVFKSVPMNRPLPTKLMSRDKQGKAETLTERGDTKRNRRTCVVKGFAEAVTLMRPSTWSTGVRCPPPLGYCEVHPRSNG